MSRLYDIIFCLLSVSHIILSTFFLESTAFVFNQFIKSLSVDSSLGTFFLVFYIFYGFIPSNNQLSFIVFPLSPCSTKIIIQKSPFNLDRISSKVSLLSTRKPTSLNSSALWPRSVIFTALFHNICLLLAHFILISTNN